MMQVMVIRFLLVVGLASATELPKVTAAPAAIMNPMAFRRVICATACPVECTLDSLTLAEH
jgi:hypothetical protein